MTLRRSSGSLGSLHRFYQADLVIFCEGGPSLTVEEAVATAKTPSTLDTIFWTSVIANLGIVKKCHVKSVGSKPTLVSIADDVEALNIQSVTICLDSDYDRVSGRVSSCRRVVYTFGYSWESDVLSQSVLEKILACLVGPIPEQTRQLLVGALTRLEKDLVKWCEIDIALAVRKGIYILNRNKPLSSADMQSIPPCLGEGKLTASLRNLGYARRPKRVVRVSPSNSIRIAYGKLVSRLLYHMVVTFAKQAIPGVRLDFDMFLRMAIAETFGFIQAGQLQDVGLHYSNQRNAFS
jgi:hypothetical protein